MFLVCVSDQARRLADTERKPVRMEPGLAARRARMGSAKPCRARTPLGPAVTQRRPEHAPVQTRFRLIYWAQVEATEMPSASQFILVPSFYCALLARRRIFQRRPRQGRPVRRTIPSARASRRSPRFTTLVEQNFADPVKPDKAIYNGAIPGMLRELDPHSNFFRSQRVSRSARGSERPLLTASA